jgi:hypothetical protein
MIPKSKENAKVGLLLGVHSSNVSNRRAACVTMALNSGSKMSYSVSALMKAARRDMELVVAASERVNAEMQASPPAAVERFWMGVNASNQFAISESRAFCS